MVVDHYLRIGVCPVSESSAAQSALQSLTLILPLGHDGFYADACCEHAGLVFDWLYPAHFPTILACLDAWSDEPAVSTPILKFMAEFVMNKTQRLAFDASSASGILLFREVSKVTEHIHRHSEAQADVSGILRDC